MTDNIRINGVKIRWIDCKAFFGADVGYFRTKTAKQVAEYVKRWGSGAIVYKYGFCSTLTMDKVVMIDAKSLQ